MAKKPTSGKFGTNGGNGGYSKKAPVKDTPMVKRNRQLHDYHGNKSSKSK